MPPKAKFTKDEIIDAGLAILRERDISAVTAREIGNYLGSSARPIFTVFDNMGEVLNGIEAKSREIYSEYVEQGLQQTPAFKGVGQSYIQFAINEPKLFQLLFMRKTSGNIGVNRILPEIDDNYTDILKSITDEEFFPNRVTRDLVQNGYELSKYGIEFQYKRTHSGRIIHLDYYSERDGSDGKNGDKVTVTQRYIKTSQTSIQR